MTSLSNEFPIDGIRKLSRISMCTYILIAEGMIAISTDPLNDLQHHITTDLGNLLVFFFWQSFLNVTSRISQSIYPHLFYSLSLSLSIYIYIYIYIYFCMYMYVQRYLSIYLSICVCVSVCMYMYIQRYLSISIQICIHIYIYIIIYI